MSYLPINIISSQFCLEELSNNVFLVEHMLKASDSNLRTEASDQGL